MGRGNSPGTRRKPGNPNGYDNWFHSQGGCDYVMWGTGTKRGRPRSNSERLREADQARVLELKSQRRKDKRTKSPKKGFKKTKKKGRPKKAKSGARKKPSGKSSSPSPKKRGRGRKARDC